MLYNSTYAPTNPIDEENDIVADDDLLDHIYKKRRTSRNENELEVYLGSPTVPADIDLLQWWKV